MCFSVLLPNKASDNNDYLQTTTKVFICCFKYLPMSSKGEHKEIGIRYGTFSLIWTKMKVNQDIATLNVFIIISIGILWPFR